VELKPEPVNKPILSAEAKPFEAKKLVIPADLGKNLEKETVVPVEIKNPVVPVEFKNPVVPIEVKKPVVPVEVKNPVVPVEVKNPVVPVEVKKEIVSVEKTPEPIKKLINPADFGKNAETVLPTKSSKKELLADLLKENPSVAKDGILMKSIIPGDLLEDIVKRPTLTAKTTKKPLSADLQKDIINKPTLFNSKKLDSNTDQFEIIEHEMTKHEEPAVIVDLFAQQPLAPQDLDMNHHAQPSSLKKDPIKPIDSKKKAIKESQPSKKSKDLSSSDIDDFEEISFDHSDKIDDDWILSNQKGEIELAPVKSKEVIPGEPGEFEDVELNSVHSRRLLADAAEADKDGWEVV
jgi:hypothetical protein